MMLRCICLFLALAVVGCSGHQQITTATHTVPAVKGDAIQSMGTDNPPKVGGGTTK